MHAHKLCVRRAQVSKHTDSACKYRYHQRVSEYRQYRIFGIGIGPPLIMDTTKLKGGSNERPCQFVKRLEVIGKFVVTHKLRKTGMGCERGSSNRAGGGTFTKGGVSCTVSPLAHAKAGGRERTGHGCSLNLSLPKVALYLHSRTAPAMRFNGPIRWDMKQLEPGHQGFMAT